MTELSAVILAGGRSSRMKTDKAELELSDIQAAFYGNFGYNDIGI